MSTRTGVRATVVAFASCVLAMGPAAMADQRPGQLGYEGQPGNQGG